MKTVKSIKSLVLVLVVSIATTLTACNEQGSGEASGANSSTSKVSALKALLADPNAFQEALNQANSLNADPDYSLTAEELAFLQGEGLLTPEEVQQLSQLVAHN